MVNLFGKKKVQEGLPMPEEQFEEPEPSIKEQVGYPTSDLPAEGGYAEVPPGEPPQFPEFPESQEGQQYNYPPQEGQQYEGAEAPPEGEYPPFLPPPQGGEMPPGAGAEMFSREDVEKIARDVAEEIKKEFEEKIQKLTDELDELKKLDEDVTKMYGTFEKLNDKYSELEDKISTLPTQTEQDLKEIKDAVNSTNQIMSTALPALIKEVRDLKAVK